MFSFELHLFIYPSYYTLVSPSWAKNSANSATIHWTSW